MKLQKTLTHFSVSSNFFFLVPFVLSLYAKLWSMAVLLGIVILTSIFYHINYKNYLRISDLVFSWALVLANLGLVLLVNFSDIYSKLALFSAGVAIYYRYRSYRERYEFNHGMWHFFSSLVTVFAILAYLL